MSNPWKEKQPLRNAINARNFFHHSRFCQRDPKYLKCAGNHLTKNCVKPADTPAKCCHCNGPHTANFSGCPQNLLNKKQEKEAKQKRNTLNPVPQNAWSNSAAIDKFRTANKSPLSAPRQIQAQTPQIPIQVANHPGNNLILTQISQMMTTFLSKLASVLQNPHVLQHV
ncbi:hypothetical protein AVEN_44135-1 [Araneus ventricosus]|uniref:Nucleic-acid-binding protein from transposon X-element n=1 Tax=Araneus ventricosus TaxID=182803 RepID=A0A4Y2DAR7_ARAVE|nr:hypothetical protein AVEN_44135-1 [Araneus ventricosus]